MTTHDLPARQVAQTFYANVLKPTVPQFFQAVEAARLAHTAADTAQLEAAMAALFSGPASSTGVRFTKKNSSVSKQGDHSYSFSSSSPTSIVTSVMSATRRHSADDSFIIDTGCSRDVIVPDRSYLDGEWCDDKQETMLAFDGHQVRSQGTGQWCRLPALVCASAPPLVNPSALCRLFVNTSVLMRLEVQ